MLILLKKLIIIQKTLFFYGKVVNLVRVIMDLC